MIRKGGGGGKYTVKGAGEMRMKRNITQIGLFVHPISGGMEYVCGSWLGTPHTHPYWWYEGMGEAIWEIGG